MASSISTSVLMFGECPIPIDASIHSCRDAAASSPAPCAARIEQRFRVHSDLDVQEASAQRVRCNACLPLVFQRESGAAFRQRERDQHLAGIAVTPGALVAARDAELEFVDAETALGVRGDFLAGSGAEMEGQRRGGRFKSEGPLEVGLAVLVAHILEIIFHRDVAVVVEERRPPPGIQVIAPELVAVILWKRVAGLSFVGPVFLRRFQAVERNARGKEICSVPRG